MKPDSATVMTKWFRWSDRPVAVEPSRLIARRIWIAIVIITGGLLQFPAALGNKEVQSIALAPSSVGPNTNFNITVTAFYDESVNGGKNDTNFNSMAYTIDGSTSCINNGSTEVLTTTPTAYGPYTVTSPNVADGTYSVSVDIFSNQNCRNSGQSSASNGPASADLTISSGNNSPVAADDAAITNEEQAVVIDVSANDSDSDGTLDLTSVVVTQDPLNGSTVVDAVSGEVTYTPEADFDGDDTFAYTIADNDGATSNAAAVSVTVNGTNDPPTLSGDYSATVIKGDSYTLTTSDLFYSDIDDGDAGVTFTVSGPTNGNTQLSGVNALAFTAADLVAGNVRFLHDDSDTATAQFTVSVDDGNEDGSAPGSQIFSISVVSANESYLEVGTFYDLSDEPLELVTPSSPNVLVLQDTSDSLNADIMTEEVDGYYPDPGDVDSPYDNIYSIPGGNDAPTESDSPGIGFWRLRSKDYNKIYYNPEVQYEPWALCDGTGDAPDGCLSGGDLNAPAADLYYYYVWDDKLEADCPSGTEGEVDSLPSPSTDPTDPCTEGYLVSIKSETGTQGAASSLASLRDFTPTNYDDGNALYPKFPNRNDCASDSHCTLAEEQANFENYYVWYRTRGFAMKASIGKVMSEADQNLRVGFAGSNGNNNDVELRDLNAAQGADTQINLLLKGLYERTYQGNSQFYDAFDKSGKYLACQKTNVMNVAGGGDPTDGDDFNSPGCPALPAPQGTCQQNYILLVTDGGMEGVARGDEHDNDGVDEPPTSDFDGAMFAGCATCSDNLADIAMYYYERDLFNGTKDGKVDATMELTNDVVPLQRDLDYAPAGAISGNAMHQHIKTFVVAFGIDSGLTDVPASYQAGAYDWGASEDANFKIKDLHHAAVNGRGAYLDAQNPAELTSALEQAFSEFSSGIGAGSAVSFNSQEITNGVVLFRSFYNLLENSGDVVAATLDADLNVGANIWSTASELDDQLLGGVSARDIFTFDPVSNEGVPLSLANLSVAQKTALGWLADGSMDAVVTEKINYFRGSAADEQPNGDYRTRPTENGRLGDIINSSPVFVGAPEALFRGGIHFPTGAKSYAAFKTAQAARADRLYVSANDGMLHSIDPETGEEVFAYMPDATLTNASNTKATELLSPSYDHQYILDATPVVEDIYGYAKDAAAKSWRTLLIGAFGAGGKGLFALDVTDPNITESNADDVVLWEFTDMDDTHPKDSNGVLLQAGGGGLRTDSLGRPVRDFGLTIDEPVIVMSNVKSADADGNLEWMALQSSGLNSTSGIAKLFGLFIDRGQDGVWCHPDSVDTEGSLRSGCAASDYDFFKIDTGFGSLTEDGNILPNGLGSPRAIDADQDGTADYVYAGDLRGNLYRFDLCRSDLPEWEATSALTEYSGVAGQCKKGTDIFSSWSVQTIFSATYTDSGGTVTAQPILNKPLVVENTGKAGYVVIFGTGRYVVNGDRTDTNIQTIYGIWDQLDSSTVSRSELIQQEYTNICESQIIDGVATDVCGRSLSDNAVAYLDSDDVGVPSVKGWYNDLEAYAAGGADGDPPEHPGERAVRNFQLRGGVGFVNSVIPTVSNACSSSAGGFGLAFCPLTGGSSCIEDGIFDINNDGLFNASDLISGFIVAGTIFEDSAPTDAAFVGENRVTQLTDRSLDIVKTNTAATTNTGRLSWRRMTNAP